MQQESSTSKSLEERFLNPPISVKPYVWWHWMGSKFSKEGITKDLEAMRESGIITVLTVSLNKLVWLVRLNWFLNLKVNCKM
jgi:hypothetical protein